MTKKQLMQKLSNLSLYTKYCIKKKRPLIKTYRQLKIIKKETTQAISFLIQTDYLNKKSRDSIYLFNDYIKKCQSLSTQDIRDIMNNKTELYKRCPHLLGREYIVLKDSTEEEILSFIKRHQKFVGKRNFGSFAQQFSCYDNTTMPIDTILRNIQENGQVMLEEYITQHENISKIYPNAINTLRIHTANNGTEIRSFIKPKLRIGCDNSITDANTSGGTYRAILNLDGTVAMSAYMNASGILKKAEKHHNSKISFSDVRIPFVKEAIDLAIEAASYYPEISYIGWDIAITPTGPVIVEGNAISGCFNTYQIINYIYNGVGLKKEIDEMLDYCYKTTASSCTALGLAEHANTCLQLPTVYLWGGLGEIISEETIEDRKSIYPKVYTTEHCDKLRECIGKNIHGFDCSGLIKNYIMGGLNHYEYAPMYDLNSEMMLKQAKKSETIESLPEQAGVCLYMPGHVGIYMGNQEVIESTSNPKFGNGVVKTKLSDRKWTHWFYCPGIEYDE